MPLPVLLSLLFSGRGSPRGQAIFSGLRPAKIGAPLKDPSEAQVRPVQRPSRPGDLFRERGTDWRENSASLTDMAAGPGPPLVALSPISGESEMGCPESRMYRIWVERRAGLSEKWALQIADHQGGREDFHTRKTASYITAHPGGWGRDLRHRKSFLSAQAEQVPRLSGPC